MRHLFWALLGGVLLSPSALAEDNLAAGAIQVLRDRCAACHQRGVAKGGMDYVLDRDTLVARRQVVPGRPEQSPLLRRIEKGEMPPPKKPAVKSEELALLKRWIEAGAPADSVTRPGALMTDAKLKSLLLADLDRLDAQQRRFTRYLTLTAQANAAARSEHMEMHRRAVSKLVNSLSWQPRIVKPESLDSTGTILRLDLRDYGWTARSWDRLAAASPYRSPADAADRVLAERTGSELPWLRADWFVATASRPPFYHDFLQLPGTDRALERLLKIDVQSNIAKRVVARSGFNGSGVARNNRLLERHEAPFGAYWRSYDFSDNTDRQNLFKHPLGPPPAQDSFRHAGGEIIFHLPNGLLAFMLVDAAGTRIDKAPGDVVSDPRRPDRLVETGLSCFSCHARGFLPKDDQVRAHVLKNSGAFPVAARRVVEALYVPATQFLRLQENDNERYARALEKAGVPASDEDPIAAVTLAYESVLDLRAATGELGQSSADFAARLRQSPEVMRTLGPLLQPGGVIQRQVFESAFRDLRQADRAVTTTSVKQAPAFTGHKGSVPALAFAPDGKRAASGGEDKTIRIWEVATGRELMRCAGHSDTVLALSFTLDGTNLVSGGLDRAIHLWDVATGKLIRVLYGSTDAVRAVMVSRDGRYLLAAGDDRTARIWELATGREVAVLSGHAGPVLSAAFAPDGRHIVTAGSDGKICVWNRKGERIGPARQGHIGPVRSLAFSPDGRQVASGGEDRTVRLWDLASGAERRRFEGHANAVITVAFTPSGRLLSASSQYRNPDRFLRLWDPAPGREAGAALPNLSPAVRVESVVFAPDGRRALVSHGAGELKLYHVAE